MNAVQPARASTLVPNSQATDQSAESVSTNDMARPNAIGTSMGRHSAGMPHSLTLVVPTGTKYPVASENIDPLPAAAVQQYSVTAEQTLIDSSPERQRKKMTLRFSGYAETEQLLATRSTSPSQESFAERPIYVPLALSHFPDTWYSTLAGTCRYYMGSASRAADATRYARTRNISTKYEAGRKRRPMNLHN